MSCADRLRCAVRTKPLRCAQSPTVTVLTVQTKPWKQSTSPCVFDHLLAYQHAVLQVGEDSPARHILEPAMRVYYIDDVDVTKATKSKVRECKR